MELKANVKKRFINNVQKVYEYYTFKYDKKNDTVEWGYDEPNSVVPFNRFIDSWYTDFINDIRDLGLGDILFKGISKANTIELIAYLISDVRF